MMCAWNKLLEILPQQMQKHVDELGRYTMQELRLRQGAQPELVLKGESKWLDLYCTREDIRFCIQTASRYSPWAAESVRKGYLTAPGGHRIGLCGLALYRNGQMQGLREITSICIRVARDFPGIAKTAPLEGSILILGAPGWGKTTLLRDLIRQRSCIEPVAVVDERGELFPDGLDVGKRTDILRGCRKREGLEQVLRTMGPKCIALDEITAFEDCQGLLRAAGCGVTLLATAHAGSVDEFMTRPIYKSLAEKGIFQWFLLMHPDKSFTVERGE